MDSGSEAVDATIIIVVADFTSHLVDDGAKCRRE
jgi:hypothetical protein